MGKACTYDLQPDPDLEDMPMCAAPSLEELQESDVVTRTPPVARQLSSRNDWEQIVKYDGVGLHERMECHRDIKVDASISADAVGWIDKTKRWHERAKSR